MSKILVLEDEVRFGETLAGALRQSGHQVRLATNAQQAIECGLSLLPDILVADWMLHESLHGLHVAEALRVVDPRLKTVLITGFPSHDLRAEARNAYVSELLVKPFEIAELEKAIERALAEPVEDGDTGDAQIGLIHCDRHLRIDYQNAVAQELINSIPDVAAVSSLQSIFGENALSLVEKSVQQWVDVKPQGAENQTWCIRSRPKSDEDGYTFVVLDEENAYCINHPIIRVLLALQDKPEIQWPIAGRVLVIDDEEMVRQLIAAHFDKLGCLCYTAATYEEGIMLFKNDSDVNVVILDYVMPEGDVEGIIAELRAIRDGAVIVGTSGVDRTDEFQAAGVDLFARKPWRVTELVELIMERALH